MNYSFILLIFTVVAVQQGFASPASDRIESGTNMAPIESSSEGADHHAQGEHDHSGHAVHNHTAMDDGFHGAHGHGVQVDQKVLQHSLTDLTKEKAIDKISKV